MDKIKRALRLFLVMFKIGLFTFGGGYAMIAVIERELVEKKKWIEQKEFVDLIAIAESTPGPLAINSATYIGYKHCGILGSIFATFGVVLPSFTIIFIISLFFDAFLQLEYVGYAFSGIQACVAFLILTAGLRMFKKLDKSYFNVVIFILAVVALTVIDLFNLSFSIIYLILIGGLVGILFYVLTVKKKPIEKMDDTKNKTEVVADEEIVIDKQMTDENKGGKE